MASSFVDRFGYNIDNAPSWTYMQAMRKKLNKSFREYAMRWRAEAVRAQPPFEEQQIKKYFVKAKEPQYLNNLNGHREEFLQNYPNRRNIRGVS